MRNGFGANRLPGAGGSRKVERQRETGGVSFAKSPPLENQIVMRDLNQRLIERSSRRWGQNDIVERASGNDRFDRTTAARETEKTGKGRHSGAQPQVVGVVGAASTRHVLIVPAHMNDRVVGVNRACWHCSFRRRSNVRRALRNYDDEKRGARERPQISPFFSALRPLR